MKVEHVEIDCDLYDHVAFGPYEDGWVTPEQSGPPARPTGRNRALPTYLPTYLPFVQALQRVGEAANYDDLYERCDERVREPVATWLNSLVTPFGISIRNVIHVHT
jgi:Fe-S-cluster formation regulator IscX/YfhJ